MNYIAVNALTKWEGWVVGWLAGYLFGWLFGGWLVVWLVGGVLKFNSLIN